MIFLVKGTCTLGAKFRGKDGSIVKEIPATFTSDPNGGSVAVGIMDDDTMEQIGNAEIYGDFDPAGFQPMAICTESQLVFADEKEVLNDD